MRYPICLLVVLLSSSLLIGCYESTGNGGGGGWILRNQFAAFEFSLRFESYPVSPHDTTYTKISGMVVGNPLPGINSFAINDSVYHSGHISFGFSSFSHSYGGVAWQPSAIETALNTTNGVLTAHITRPDTIRTLSLQNGDTLIPLNTDLHLRWSGSNATRYFCSLQYETENSNIRTIDTLVSGNELVLPGTMFSSNGYVLVEKIASIAGSYPTDGNGRNLTGDGCGWAVYSNFTSTLRRFILIGGGPFDKTKQLGAGSSAADRFHEKFVAVAMRANQKGNGWRGSLSSPPMETGRVNVGVFSTQRSGDNYVVYASGLTYGWSENRIARVVLNDTTITSPSVHIIDNSFNFYYAHVPDTIRFGMAMADDGSVPVNIAMVTRPDSVRQVNFPTNHTRTVGQPLTITWSPVRADFYSFYVQILNSISGGQFDTCVTDTSITFPGSMFRNPANVYIFGPIPVNGPVPRANTVVGTHNGVASFLYYQLTLNARYGIYNIVAATDDKKQSAKSIPVNEPTGLSVMR